MHCHPSLRRQQAFVGLELICGAGDLLAADGQQIPPRHKH
jgi:hypothetical protein